jgi:FkbM family methyltransferase
MKDIGEFLVSGVIPLDGEVTIFEVGAHVGSDSLKLRQCFPRARIHCFEPDPRNVFAFKQAGVHKVVTLVEAAVGAEDGTAEMFLSTGAPKRPDPNLKSGVWTYSSSLKPPRDHLRRFPWVKFEARAKVRVIRLDTYVEQQGIGVVDFLWADVQGAEDQLIAGGQRALARTRYLYTEYADQPLYEGQIPLDEIVRRLPGRWDVLARFPDDALLRNAAFPADPLPAYLGVTG